MRIEFYVRSHEDEVKKPFFICRNWPSDIPQTGWQITFLLASMDSKEQTEFQKIGAVVDVQEDEGLVQVWMDMGEGFIQNLRRSLVRTITWKAMSRLEKQKA